MSVATEVKRIETVSMLERTGIAMSRYGLAIILLLIGLAKFTPEEAAGTAAEALGAKRCGCDYGSE